MSVQPLGLLLLSGLAGFLFLSYRAYEALDERYSSLELLNEFTRLVGASRTVDEVLDGIRFDGALFRRDIGHRAVKR